MKASVAARPTSGVFCRAQMIISSVARKLSGSRDPLPGSGGDWRVEAAADLPCARPRSGRSLDVELSEGEFFKDACPLGGLLPSAKRTALVPPGGQPGVSARRTGPLGGLPNADVSPAR